MLGTKHLPTPRAIPERWRASYSSPAVSIEGCRTVRTNHPQVLETIVVPHSIDVVENHRHVTAQPRLSLALLGRTSHSEGVSSPPRAIAASGCCDCPSSARRGSPQAEVSAFESSPYTAVGIEVINGDPPCRRILLQGRGVSPTGTVAQATQRFGPRLRLRDGRASLLLSKPHPSPCHLAIVPNTSDRKLQCCSPPP